MKSKSYKSIFLQCNYCRKYYTGDGFKLRCRLKPLGLTLKVYWGPYEDSRYLSIFLGFDLYEYRHRRHLKWVRKLTPEQTKNLEEALNRLKEVILGESAINGNADI